MHTIAGPAIIAAGGGTSFSGDTTRPAQQTASHAVSPQATPFSLPSSPGGGGASVTKVHFGLAAGPAPGRPAPVTTGAVAASGAQPKNAENGPLAISGSDAATPGSVLVPLSDALSRIPLSVNAPKHDPAPPVGTASDHPPSERDQSDSTLNSDELPGLTALFEALSKLKETPSDTPPTVDTTASAQTISSVVAAEPDSSASDLSTAGVVPRPVVASIPSQSASSGPAADNSPDVQLPDPSPTESRTDAQAAHLRTGAATDTTTSTPPKFANAGTARTAASGTARVAETARQVTIDTPTISSAPDSPTPPVSSARPESTAAAVDQASKTGTPAQTGSPARPVSYIEQISARFIDNFNGRVQRFEIRLDPPELGQVDVSIEIGTDQKIRAVLATSETASLLELMRGARALEADLARAGIDLADDKGLTFRLDRDGTDQGTRKHGNHADQSQTSTDQPVPDNPDQETSADAPGDLTVIHRMRTDMRV